MQFIDEKDHRPAESCTPSGPPSTALRIRRDTSLQLSARHIEGDDALVLERLGNIPANDSLRKPFDNRSLSDARLADQDGIIFRSAERTWMTRRISSSRPMTGSSFPAPQV